MAEELAAFTVIADGKKYEIFRSGEVRGFEGESIFVNNHIPTYEAGAVLDFCRARGITI